MTAVYDEFEDSEDIVRLLFKKAAEKRFTLNAAFKKVFGEALEPLGFKLIKSKYPYFVRVVNDEIIHVVFVCKNKCETSSRKSFYVVFGVAIIYRGEIDFNINPEDLFLQPISTI